MSLKLRISLILNSLLLTLTFTLKSKKEKIKNKTTTNAMTFPIVNFPFISSNIPASPAYGVYISQLIRYSTACVQYSDFLYRVRLLTQKLLKQDYVAQMTLDLLHYAYYQDVRCDPIEF